MSNLSNDRYEKDANLLFKLEEDMQPVRDLIKEKKFREANQLLSDLLNQQYGSFVVKYRKLIEPMTYLNPDEYAEWIKSRHNFYPYTTPISRELKESPKLPAIVSFERIIPQPFVNILKGETHDDNN